MDGFRPAVVGSYPPDIPGMGNHASGEGAHDLPAAAKLTVLSEPPEREIEMACTIEERGSESMRLRVAQSIPLDTALSIEFGEAMWLGQTDGCQEQERGFLIEVKLFHYLPRLPELARMAERFRGIPDGRRSSDRGGLN